MYLNLFPNQISLPVGRIFFHVERLTDNSLGIVVFTCAYDRWLWLATKPKWNYGRDLFNTLHYVIGKSASIVGVINCNQISSSDLGYDNMLFVSGLWDKKVQKAFAPIAAWNLSAAEALGIVLPVGAFYTAGSSVADANGIIYNM